MTARAARGNCPERCKSVVLKIHKHGENKRKNILWEAGCLRRVAHAHIIQLIDVRASTTGEEEDPGTQDRAVARLPAHRAEL